MRIKSGDRVIAKDAITGYCHARDTLTVLAVGGSNLADFNWDYWVCAERGFRFGVQSHEIMDKVEEELDYQI